jgi:hypothetical protein
VIGILSPVDHLRIAQEFFELFKTPWEAYQPGRRYDVVIAPAGPVPDVEARVLVVCGAGSSSVDAMCGIVRGAGCDGGSMEVDGRRVPLYGRVCSFSEASAGAPCVRSRDGVLGLVVPTDRFVLVRLGYDLFAEARALLMDGQPVEHAATPTLDIHTGLLRRWIVEAGVPLLEIAAAPAAHDYIVCLTHDIDFVGIRRHLFDHTMFGFLYRSTIGAVGNVLARRLSLRRLLSCWQAAASLPLVYLGWMKDFWEPFGWYLQVERGLPATYYLIPFKGRAGARVPGQAASRRATAYDVTDLDRDCARLLDAGCELGVHGIDAWHDEVRGREELERIAAVTGRTDAGIRMHWLLSDRTTPAVLARAGYAYDSTAGYNETVGYRNGTTQVFQPAGAGTLLELPLHIQDGALFYPQRLHLSERQAEERCAAMIAHARAAGGVLTVLWHDRSHGPERFWGDFYIRLVAALKATNPWFATAAQAVGWSRQRRGVRFERVDAAGTRVRLRYDGASIRPPLRVTVHGAGGTRTDTSWNGETAFEAGTGAREPEPAGCVS